MNETDTRILNAINIANLVKKKHEIERTISLIQQCYNSDNLYYLAIAMDLNGKTEIVTKLIYDYCPVSKPVEQSMIDTLNYKINHINQQIQKLL